MAGLVPAIHVFLAKAEDVDARHIRAFTPVFDGLWPGMTAEKSVPYEGRHIFDAGRPMLGPGLEARRGQMTTLKTLHAAALGAALLAGTGAFAQERGPGLLDNLFNRGEGTQQREAPAAAASELSVRLDRLENRLREMTGQIEQLQFRNQQLEQEIARLTGRAPVAAAAPRPPITAPSIPPAQSIPSQVTPAQTMPAPATSGRRSDAFDPSQNPNAPRSE